MIIFIYGQDVYRSRQKLKEIIAKYEKVHKNGLSLKYFDASENNIGIEELKLETRSLSMFKETKLIVLCDFFSIKEFKEKFLKNTKFFQESKDIIIFYETGKILESSVLFKFLKKTAKCQEFKLLSPLQLRLWAKKEFEKYNCKAKDETIDKLIQSTGNDLWRLDNEIMKLASYKNEVKEEDIDLLVEPNVQADIFKTIDFLAQKNKKQAILALKKHLQKGESPLYLFSMINFQFRNLILVKYFQSQNSYPGNSDREGFSYGFYKGNNNSKEIASRLQMHPFVAQKTSIMAGKFTAEELKKIYHKIFRADIDIKTGKLKPEEALDLLVATI